VYNPDEQTHLPAGINDVTLVYAILRFAVYQRFFFLKKKLMEASSACMTGASARCKIAILRYVYTLLK
jgi:hypothetical protein